MSQSQADPRSVFSAEKSGESKRPKSNRLTPGRADASDAARGLMHGIFVGEIQALEGAGRTCHDFETGTSDAIDTVPFELKLDMARQAWDEARHVEISVMLSDWMGTEIGQYAENTVLFEAACSNGMLDIAEQLTGSIRQQAGATLRDLALAANEILAADAA